MQTLVSRERQSPVRLDQHSYIFIKQIFICFKNDIILTTVDHTNDARPATSAAQPAVAHACDAAPSFSSGLQIRSCSVVISMELSMNNRRTVDFFLAASRSSSG